MKSSWKNLIWEDELYFWKKHGVGGRCVCTGYAGDEPIISP
jgi:hypothetical protein